MKKNNIYIIKRTQLIIGCIVLLFGFSISAKENVTIPGVTTVVYPKIASGCSPSTSQTELDINNVRTTIMGGGDMWWNLDDARYEIPKDGNRHSMFAGALWIGGVDAGGQLKVAAMTYRQGGNDFWPGPLTATAITDATSCSEWDQHFKINRSEVEEHVNKWQTDMQYRNDPNNYPEAIQEWPAHPELVDGTILGADHYLAPFYDYNGDGEYFPLDGDYPDYNITGDNDLAKLYGDQTLYWIFNDKGNIHTESEAEPLGLEIRAQAFGFTSDNEVNDMTFYNYQIINRSTIPLEDTYFGQWVDPDLGFYLDDYVGCDVGLGLGFCYNGDAEDEGANGYGYTPPAIGVDFFQGPLADPNDGIDNDRDGTIDEIGEEIIMSKFVYYNNDFTVIGNPSSATHFYNYLRGIWKDNVPMTWGGDGHGSGQGSTNDLCNFMFPGTSDPEFLGQEWTEVTAGNTPADRRFLQSAGSFTLQPGAVNEITTGVVWARASTGGNTASVALVKIYDKEAQALFDNNFNILNGPDAPDLAILELENELVFTISNKVSSNNAALDPVTGELLTEVYSEKDPYITKPFNILNSPDYTFQGYLVYQLKDATVTQTDLDNPDKARLIFRTDIKDTVTNIINQYLDPTLGVYTPVEEVSAHLSEGALGSVDKGIQYSFNVVTDRFATSSPPVLVNHRTYYFMALAYGYNRAEENADPYNVNDPNYDGRNRPFIQSRRNIKSYPAIPHSISPENGGTVLGSSYGDGFKVRVLTGTGNGGNSLDLTEATVDNILNSKEAMTQLLEYKENRGPISVSVVNPAEIKEGYYQLELNEPIISSNNVVTGYGMWRLLDGVNPADVIVTSNTPIVLGSNKYISELGLDISITDAISPGQDPLNYPNNGLISSEIEYLDAFGGVSNNKWLSGVPDIDEPWQGFPAGGLYGINWIRAGSYTDDNNSLFSDYNQNDDPNGVYEGLIEQTQGLEAFGGTPLTGGTWAPYRFASTYDDGPGFNKTVTQSYVKIADLHSVDIVFTPDTAHWSRCVVLEAQDDPALAVGGQEKMGIRKSPSVDKCGFSDPNAPSPNGWGWFPGYAIDIETGERLNIVFAEDSWLTAENGRDMIWNPTSNMTTDNLGWDFNSGTFTVTQGAFLLGGKHFIYVVRGESWVKGTEDYIAGNYTDVDDSPNYDECKWIYGQLNDGGLFGKFNVFGNVSWTSIPLLQSNNIELLPVCEGLVPSIAKVKLRVGKSYKPHATLFGQDFVPLCDNPDEITLGLIGCTPEDKQHGTHQAITDTTWDNDGVVINIQPRIRDRNMILDTGEVYVVAYLNDLTTWGGRSITHDGKDYDPGDIFVATTADFSGNTRARVIDLDLRFNFPNTITILDSYGYPIQIDISNIENVPDSLIDDSLAILNLGFNGMNPTYFFNTIVKSVTVQDKTTAKSALDMINVVPNPYYGYSEYENNQLDNRIKITNLPQRATISIFTISGTLVRRLKKDNSMTSMDWDLKNSYGIPVASGLYVLHIDTPHGEKILKWFGAMRPIDLDIF
ncbi:MAG: hypothetical protein VX347_00480 [Bacteroidota bacterium]|nr:hypothetical protein [Bacteroidota bacterium]